MKKFLICLGALLVTALLTAYVFRAELGERYDAFLTNDMFVGAEHANSAHGPAIGSSFPGLQATYQGRRVTLLNEFAGPNGTLLVALRSVDWCPYCKRQLLHLQEYLPFFHAAGIGVVVVTYDAPATQASFIERFGISIPLLSDDSGLTFRTLGILDEQYEPGDPEYGIPTPGMIVVDADSRVVGKLFLDDYSQRVDSSSALAYARAELGLKPPFGS
ncbi:MAG: peroxiredoxin family protein [Halioglobus sp.]|nr:peroxiredoxin family protein [Halioglobus sp.]